VVFKGVLETSKERKLLLAARQELLGQPVLLGQLEQLVLPEVLEPQPLKVERRRSLLASISTPSM
jgi:hypothetical protein